MRNQVLMTVLLSGFAPALYAQVVSAPTLEEAGQAARTMVQASSERRIQRGPILVIERRGKLYISAITILVEAQEKKTLVSAVLESGFPKEMGVDSRIGSIDAPRVMTVDEYVEQSVMSKLKGASKAPPGAVIEPVPDFVRKQWGDEIRKQVMTDLGNNLAVVYRYIGTK